MIHEAGLALFTARGVSATSSGTAHSSIRSDGPRASVNAPRTLTDGRARARARSLPSGLSWPWPADEMTINLAPGILASAVNRREVDLIVGVGVEFVNDG